jgi:hypothetical protein
MVVGIWKLYEAVAGKRPQFVDDFAMRLRKLLDWLDPHDTMITKLLQLAGV